MAKLMIPPTMTWWVQGSQISVLTYGSYIIVKI